MKESSDLTKAGMVALALTSIQQKTCSQAGAYLNITGHTEPDNEATMIMPNGVDLGPWGNAQFINYASMPANGGYSIEMKFDASVLDASSSLNIIQHFDFVYFIKFYDDDEPYVLDWNDQWYLDAAAAGMNDDVTPSTTPGNVGFVYSWDNPHTTINAATYPYNYCWPGDELHTKLNFKTFVEGQVDGVTANIQLDWHVEHVFIFDGDTSPGGYEGFKPQTSAFKAGIGHQSLNEKPN